MLERCPEHGAIGDQSRVETKTPAAVGRPLAPTKMTRFRANCNVKVSRWKTGWALAAIAAFNASPSFCSSAFKFPVYLYMCIRLPNARGTTCRSVVQSHFPRPARSSYYNFGISSPENGRSGGNDQGAASVRRDSKRRTYQQAGQDLASSTGHEPLRGDCDKVDSPF